MKIIEGKDSAKNSKQEGTLLGISRLVLLPLPECPPSGHALQDARMGIN